MGLGWALLMPVTLMLLFVGVFTHVAKIETGDAPYALFAYVGLLP